MSFIFPYLTIVLECVKCDKMCVLLFGLQFTPTEYLASYGRFSKSIKPDECGMWRNIQLNRGGAQTDPYLCWGSSLWGVQGRSIDSSIRNQCQGSQNTEDEPHGSRKTSGWVPRISVSCH
jgi:hypothetical protein